MTNARISAPAAAAFLCFFIVSGAAAETLPKTYGVVYEHWTSPELRRPLELWVRKAIARALPEASVTFFGPHGERRPNIPIIFSVASWSSETLPSLELKELLSTGVPLGTMALERLNREYRGSIAGSSACLVLIDVPAIRVSARKQRATGANVSSPVPGEAVVRFPAWLSGKPAGFAYVHPNFAHFNLVLVTAGGAWDGTPESGKQALVEDCGASAARRIAQDSGMTIIPANLELME